ncbi:nucleotidyl transferase AbiEii/AbiGii toxin family protein [Desulfonema limicola]|uniref:nucleotidyl transferase AbiEii/AbiGii toxin family protein n=1 Tax=Desulfonema limicola TaxID=45656 RepID=UPI001A9C206F|nr:nucleotidyl transferase AbiEii/AbiGii toxin family protein [Desulfonema limicola]
MTGFLKTFQKQIEAFEVAYKEALHSFPPEAWSWGGGTVLSLYYFHHRKSFDVDIFIRDPQIFPYLSPKWLLDNDKTAFSYDYHEAADHIRLVVSKSGIKVDFILSPLILNSGVVKNILLQTGFDFYVETIDEIIAKKIKFRRKYNITRDIFDIAAALTHQPEILQKLYQLKILKLEDIVELNMTLESLDMYRYKKEIELISPDRKMKDISENSRDIIMKAIDILRNKILK